jgi:hypothetical protein
MGDEYVFLFILLMGERMPDEVAIYLCEIRHKVEG